MVGTFSSCRAILIAILAEPHPDIAHILLLRRFPLSYDAQSAMIESGIVETKKQVTIRKGSIEERPPAFTFRGGKNGRTLCCDEVEVERLARRFGTPLYVYSATAIRARVAAYERAFEKQSHTLCYSVKANSNLSVLRLLASLGCGFDVVSGGELQRVMRASQKCRPQRRLLRRRQNRRGDGRGHCSRNPALQRGERSRAGAAGRARRTPEENRAHRLPGQSRRQAPEPIRISAPA